MPMKFDQDLFLCQNKAGFGCNYTSCHTDDLLIAADNAQEILDSLMKVKKVTNLGPTIYYHRCAGILKKPNPNIGQQTDNS